MTQQPPLQPEQQSPQPSPDGGQQPRFAAEPWTDAPAQAGHPHQGYPQQGFSQQPGDGGYAQAVDAASRTVPNPMLGGLLGAGVGLAAIIVGSVLVGQTAAPMCGAEAMLPGDICEISGRTTSSYSYDRMVTASRALPIGMIWGGIVALIVAGVHLLQMRGLVRTTAPVPPREPASPLARWHGAGPIAYPAKAAAGLIIGGGVGVALFVNRVLTPSGGAPVLVVGFLMAILGVAILLMHGRPEAAQILRTDEHGVERFRGEERARIPWGEMTKSKLAKNQAGARWIIRSKSSGSLNLRQPEHLQDGLLIARLQARGPVQ